MDPFPSENDPNRNEKVLNWLGQWGILKICELIAEDIVSEESTPKRRRNSQSPEYGAVSQQVTKITIIHNFDAAVPLTEEEPKKEKVLFTPSQTLKQIIEVEMAMLASAQKRLEKVFDEKKKEELRKEIKELEKSIAGHRHKLDKCI